MGLVPGGTRVLVPLVAAYKFEGYSVCSMGTKRPRVSEEVMRRVETVVQDRVAGADDYSFSQQLEALVTLLETTPTDQQSVREAQEVAEGDRPDEWPSRYHWPPQTADGLHEAIRRGLIEVPDIRNASVSVDTSGRDSESSTPEGPGYSSPSRLRK